LKDVQRRGDAVLFVQSLCLALATPALLRLPLPYLDALLEWTARRGRARPRGNPDSVSTTVLQMLQTGRPLVRRGCLTRGITLYTFLRRAGVDVTLAFGMGRVPRDRTSPGHGDYGDGFDGHCWLVLDGEPYLEPRDPRADFAAIYSFPRGAARSRLSTIG
jgi:hypothetical protein